MQKHGKIDVALKKHAKTGQKRTKKWKTRKKHVQKHANAQKHTQKHVQKHKTRPKKNVNPCGFWIFFWSPGISTKTRTFITAPTWDDRGGRKKKK